MPPAAAQFSVLGSQPMPYLAANSVELYYEVHGSGFPLVLTHGSSWDHRQWQPQVAAFAPDFQVVVWDVRGHGRSSLPPGPVDANDFSRDLVALLDHLGLERAVLCGLSLGGHVSLRTAARFPDRVAALVLIGTPCTNSFDWYERLLMPVNRFSQRFVPMRLAARLQAQALGKYNPQVRPYITEVVAQMPLERWVRLWNAISRMESRADLARVVCPTLLLEGDDDWMTHRQQAYLAAQIRGAVHQIIPRAGHATSLDNPQAVNQAIRAFVQARGIG